MTGIIIQARLGSTRLPRKALLPIAGKPMIAHAIERCLETGFPVFLAVPGDDLQEFTNTLSPLFGNFKALHYFGGHPTDVLDRYYEVAKYYAIDPIVRIAGDCPLVDPDMIKAMVKEFRGGYFSNCHPERTVPPGLDIEVFDFETLRKAQFIIHQIENPSMAEKYKEHVTNGMYLYLLGHIRVHTYSPPFPDSWKVSIDTQEDYERVKAMIEGGQYPWQS